MCDKTLEQLDELESVGILYDRQIISVVLESDKNFNGECMDVNAYILSNFKENMLQLPFISNYAAKHAEQYITAAKRDGKYIQVVESVKKSS